MPYTGIKFGDLKAQLAERLNDSSQVFHTNTELGIHLQDAIRFWNVLTGDNKVNYALPVTATNPVTVWYDLLKLTGSPRLAANTDQNIYTRLTYALLEPPSATAQLLTGQFITDDLVKATQRKRDEFIFRTKCTSSLELLAVAANTPTVALPQTVIQARRCYWLPSLNGLASPLFPLDEGSILAYQPFAPGTPGQPVGFSAGMEPPLLAEIIPPPLVDGQAEFITIESQAALVPANPTTLLMPNDFTPALFWGAMADLLMIPFEAMDATRAKLAQQRYEEFVELMVNYPFVFASRINGVSTPVNSVEALDIYSPSWRTLSSNPLVVGISGQNLIAFPSTQTMQIILIMLADANLPVNDAAFLQLGPEVIDAILDEAQSTACFKLGGAEAVEAFQLHGNIIKLAAQRNEKVRAMSCFRDTLYGITQREAQFAPTEINVSE